MPRSWLIATSLFVLLWADAADSMPLSTCGKNTQQFLVDPKSWCRGASCPQDQAKSDGYSYIEGLKGAFKTAQGLRDFLAYLSRSQIIGAPAEEVACNAVAVAEHWGDGELAQSLTRFSRSDQSDILRWIDYASGSDEFAQRFPQTYEIWKTANKPGVSVSLATIAPAGTPIAACMKFDTPSVRLTGSVFSRKYWGPPGYGLSPSRDSKESALLLLMDAPICVDGDATNPSEYDVVLIQLAAVSIAPEKISSYVGKRVTAEGTLFHSITGHHRTAVLLDVSTVSLVAH